MNLGTPEITARDGKVYHQVRVRTSDGERNLWLCVPEGFGDMVSTTNDSSLVALLMPAMEKGDDIQVEGPVSEQLVHTLSGTYQSLLCQVMPSLRRVNIKAPHAAASDATGAGLATGFSGGIDSFSVLGDHWFRPVPARSRLTHLLYHYVVTPTPETEVLFRERFARLAPTAAKLGLPFVSVQTNVGEFYGARLNFQQTHTPRNVAAALVLQRGLSRYYYASGYAYRDIFVGATYDLAYSDPIGVPMLSTETMQPASVGGDHRRVEKTLQVAEIPESWNVLDVCVWAREAGNCSRCWKCLRTLLTLEIGGVLERYSGVFDLRQYRRSRLRYMGEVLRSRNPLLREIVEFARDRGFVFPLPGRLYARVPLGTIRDIRDRFRRSRAARLRLAP